MTIRSGEIQSTFLRIDEAGKLKVFGAALPGGESGKKIKKMTICNLNTCDEGLLISVAFIVSAAIDSTTEPLTTDKGFYILYKKSLGINSTLTLDQHYFDEAGSWSRLGAYTSLAVQIAVRVDLNPDGTSCATSSTNPLVDVHITK